MASCPICRRVPGRSRRAGDLTVLTCGTCGHGWLAGLRPENTHYESSHYVDWRTANGDVLRRRARQYVEDFRRLTPVVPRSAAEVGCSTGETIGLLAESGVTAAGADTSAGAVERAREQFPAVRFTVGTLPVLDEPVDAVLMMHVIEHIPDPVAALIEVRRLAADDGVLYLRTPNYGGAAAAVLRSAWPDLMADHLHYFTRRSLEQALTAAGWRPGAVVTEAGSWVWLGGAKRLVRRQRPSTAQGTGRPPGPRAMRVLAAADRWGRPLWSAERRSGRGNELVVVARPA